MNERIKELAHKADCTIDGMGYGEGNLEEFAELIVRECAESCTLQQDVNDMYFRLGVKR